MKVYICFPEGKAKVLTMSYDDGKEEDVRLLEIFNKYGIKGTFNLNYGMMCQDQTGQKHPRISKDRIKELYKGHEIATHTMTHPTIARCPLTEVVEEILEDRRGLESITGTLVRGHAYPNGSYNEEIKQLFRQMGIAYARVTESMADTEIAPNLAKWRRITDYSLPEDYMAWRPTCHHDDPRLMERAEFFANFEKSQYLKILYVWGHSYEFNDNDNWEVIEEFCKYMGGRPDIWYATNIEIIDYMEAARNLKFSADYCSVYNPNAQSVWLQLNGSQCVEIKGGAFVNLKEC
ncbi:MAG: polysaccharide deacetylase family protein [Lachnoclostridium sp.]|nr:polysaccharide deacetylase family protein [Lachnospira sp.]MCM1248249.1 polysaccharide deacetylase family protein [Lachnoclostridium sp.]MCM1535566.1 polysaccharide deacetylase family protein [Clostridium sp.]